MADIYPSTGACPTRPLGSCYEIPGGSPRVIVTKDGENGSPLGAGPRTRKGIPCELSTMAKEICVLEEKFEDAAVAAGANSVFSMQLRWWWQINWWVNVGDQDAETFALTLVTYGNNVPFFQTANAFQGSTINGAPYGAQNGIDLRRWNIQSFGGNFFPTPANGWEDPVVYTFTNNAGDAEDLEIMVSGPAVLQI